MIYHMVMARREILVQLDDELVRELDRLAEHLRISRSELLRRGARAVIDATDERSADEALVAAYRQQPQDIALGRSAARLAARTSPEW
jgi:metal-responsive CopG/Arc/MetJ family transcriptional regulator